MYVHVHVVINACFEKQNKCYFSMKQTNVRIICYACIYTHTCTCKFLITVLIWWNDGSKVISTTLSIVKTSTTGTYSTALSFVLVCMTYVHVHVY